MESPRCRCYLPWILSILFGSLLVYQLVDNCLTTIQTGLAEEQTAIFEQMRQKTAASHSADAGYLEYVVNYYPSGTKQVRGSRLDRIVELARQSAVREIIAILRTRTGYDLGDDPKPWIEKPRKPSN
jgi:hypothetical protein